MSVGIGSLKDPEEAQGLAHYLEHMLFMGTEKYPDENEYSNVVDHLYSLSTKTLVLIMPILPKNKQIINLRFLALLFVKLSIDSLNFSLLHWCHNLLQRDNSTQYTRNILKIFRMTLGANSNFQKVFLKKDILIRSFQLVIKLLFRTLTLTKCSSISIKQITHLISWN